MGKAALFAIAAFTLIGAYYTLSSQRGALGATDRLGNHQFEVVARNAAVTGYMRARQAIADEAGFNVMPISGSFKGAQYETTVTAVGSNRGVIVTRGWIDDSQGRQHEYNVRAEIERNVSLDEADEIPVFMRYGMASNGDLEIGGNVLVDTLRVEGNESNLINANIHTNGRLANQGNSAVIRGFGTYVTSHSGRTQVFKPYHNPTNEPVVQKVQPIDLPQSFNAAELAAALGPDRSEGSITLPATLDVRGGGNSEENPYVFFVNGTLTAPPGINILGHVIFLVQGDINLQGGVSVGDVPMSTTSVGFFGSNDIDIGGNAGVWGTIVAGNNVKFHGNPTIYGGVSIGNVAVIQGTPTIKFVAPSVGIAKPFVESYVNLTMLTYNEW
jgi:hypothetical protein